MSLQDGANLAAIGQFVVEAIVAFGGSFLAVRYIRTMRPIWRRFTQNVGREVAVVSTERQDMEHEAVLLERVGYFRVKKVSADSRNLDFINGAALIVVGYSPNSQIYTRAFEYAKMNGLPVVVFSGDHRLSDEDRNDLKQYSFSSICETDLRLVSDVFAIMSTFPRG